MSRFMAVYEQNFSEYNDDQSIVTEGFLGDVWNTIVKIFKKIWEFVKNMYDRIKQWLTDSKAKIEETKDNTISVKIQNTWFEYVTPYDACWCQGGFDRSYQAINDLYPIIAELKAASKKPEDFNIDRFMRSNNAILDKWCNFEKGSVLKFTPKQDVSPNEKINKPSKARPCDISNEQQRIDKIASDFYKTTKHMQGDLSATMVSFYKKSPGETDNTRFINSAALSLTVTINTYYNHANHCLQCLLECSSAMVDAYVKRPFIT